MTRKEDLERKIAVLAIKLAAFDRLPLEQSLGDAARIYLSRLEVVTKTIACAFVICSIPVIIALSFHHILGAIPVTMGDILNATGIAKKKAV